MRMTAYTLVGTPVESRTWAGSFHEADSKVEGSYLKFEGSLKEV
jgi:hypothetical protein